jgi:hypothetical protein
MEAALATPDSDAIPMTATANLANLRMAPFSLRNAPPFMGPGSHLRVLGHEVRETFKPKMGSWGRIFLGRPGGSGPSGGGGTRGIPLPGGSRRPQVALEKR